MNPQSKPIENKPEMVPVGTVPSIYVEGVNQMLVGFPNSRITFFNLVERPTESNPKEIRHVACELVMPTSSLIEMSQTILGTFASNASVLQSTKEEWTQKWEKLTASLIELTPLSPDTERLQR